MLPPPFPPPPPELSPPPPELSPPPPELPPPSSVSPPEDVGEPPPPHARSKNAVPPTIVSVDAFLIKSLREGSVACCSKQLQSHVFFILSVMDKNIIKKN